MVPGCTIQLAFFCMFLPCFSILILSLPLFGLGSKSTSHSSRFCVYRPKQYDTICWKLDLSGFFGPVELINMSGVLQEAGDADSRTHTRPEL